ncbi:MAG: hypothetical protein IIY33_00230, partial [Erysipelotrichaceae bacterium]|nr:hypothetical protein [Erysipelotrichaceae bacterium]
MDSSSFINKEKEAAISLKSIGELPPPPYDLGSGGSLGAATGPTNPTSGLPKNILALLEVTNLILKSNLLSIRVCQTILQHLCLNLAAAGIKLRLKGLQLLTENICLVLNRQINLVESLDRIDFIGLILLHKSICL